MPPFTTRRRKAKAARLAKLALLASKNGASEQEENTAPTEKRTVAKIAKKVNKKKVPKKTVTSKRLQNRRKKETVIGCVGRDPNCVYHSLLEYKWVLRTDQEMVNILQCHYRGMCPKSPSSDHRALAKITVTNPTSWVAYYLREQRKQYFDTALEHYDKCHCYSRNIVRERISESELSTASVETVKIDEEDEGRVNGEMSSKVATPEPSPGVSSSTELAAARTRADNMIRHYFNNLKY